MTHDPKSRYDLAHDLCCVSYGLIDCAIDIDYQGGFSDSLQAMKSRLHAMAIEIVCFAKQIEENKA